MQARNLLAISTVENFGVLRGVGSTKYMYISVGLCSVCDGRDAPHLVGVLVVEDEEDDRRGAVAPRLALNECEGAVLECAPAVALGVEVRALLSAREEEEQGGTKRRRRKKK